MLKHIWQMISAFVLSLILIFVLDAIPTQLIDSKQYFATTWAGGDLVIKQPRWAPLTLPGEVESANSIKLSTMMLYADQVQLVHLQLIDDAYPLYGQIELIQAEDNSLSTNGNIPDDSVLLDTNLANQLQISIGDTVTLGDKSFTVSGIVGRQDEQVFDFEAFSPSVFMRYDQADALGLISDTARLNHYVYLKTNDTDALKTYLEAVLPKDTRIIQPRESLGRVERIISQVVDLLWIMRFFGYIMAGFLVHLALEHYCHYRARESGILMALGTGRVKRFLYLFKPLCRAMITAGIIGVVLSLLLSGALDLVLKQLPVRITLAWSELILRSLVIYLAIFCVLLCLHLGSVLFMPALQLLRRKPRSINYLLMFLLSSMIALYATYVEWAIRDVVAYVGLSAIVCFSLYLVIYSVILMLIQLLHYGKTRALLLLNGIRLYRYEYSFVVLFISLMMTMGLFLWHVQTQTVPAWQTTIPEKSANSFMIGIQPNQVASLQESFSWLGDTSFYPIIKGRLLTINGVNAAEYKNGAYVEHESFNRQLNLTMLDTLPVGNEVISGEWPSSGISADQGIMKRLGLKQGDQLTFLIFGEAVSLPITSIRSVDWQSMRANFYFIFPPEVLEKYPASYLASAYISNEDRQDLLPLRVQYPNITILDVATFVEQAQGLINAMTYTMAVFITVMAVFGLAAFLMVLSRQREQKANQIYAMNRLGLSLTDYPVIRDELVCVLAVATICSMTIGSGLIMTINQYLTVKWQFDYYSYVILFFPWLLLSALAFLSVQDDQVSGEL